MVRLALAVLITIVIVVFSIANSHHVPLSLVVGKPVEIRLIFLLMCTFFTGMVVPIFHRLIQHAKHNKKIKREKELQQAIWQVDRDLVGE